MIELEIKGILPDIKRALSFIEENDGILIWEGMERDTYYSSPVEDFKETDKCLRVREKDDTHILTFKGPKMDSFSKSREELESLASGEIFKIMEHLGFKKVRVVEKRREVYSILGYELCLDKVNGLDGVYIEMEKKGNYNEKDLKKAKKHLKEIGVTTFERRSYLELLEI